MKTNSNVQKCEITEVFMEAEILGTWSGNETIKLTVDTIGLRDAKVNALYLLLYLHSIRTLFQ